MTGTWVNKNLHAVEDEKKYDSIFSAMKIAENNAYAGPSLQAMYRQWWDQAL